MSNCVIFGHHVIENLVDSFLETLLSMALHPSNLERERESSPFSLGFSRAKVVGGWLGGFRRLFWHLCILASSSSVTMEHLIAIVGARGEYSRLRWSPWR